MKKSIALLLILSFIVTLFCVIPQADAAGLYTVYGAVYDRHGNTVANAEVKLVNGDYATLGTQKTDANGNFRFDKMPSSSSSFAVLISYTENGKTFSINQNNARWCDGSIGLLEFDKMWTTLIDYPPPEYGYLWGTILTEGGSNPPLSGAVIYASSNEQKYYTFSAPSSGAYEMYLPVGHYSVYAQYQNAAGIYQTRPVSVDVIGTTNKLDANPLTIMVSLAAPASQPNPEKIPGTYSNTVNGTVAYADGKGVAGATVSLWQISDDSSTYIKKSDTTTDANGNYRFNDVKVTSDVGKEINGMKNFRVSSTFTDLQGNVHLKNQTFPLYNPNIILGFGGMEQSARNMSANLQFDYSTSGWIKIQTEQPGARVFVDGQALKGPDGKQLTTPCTAYLEAGTHRIRLSLSGYSDKEFYPIPIVENLETTSIICSLDKPVVPGWVIPAVAVLILLIVIGLILAVVLSKRHMFLGPLAGILGPVTQSVGSFRSSSAARKAQRDAQKAHAADAKKADRAHRAQMADASMASKPKIDRRREQDSFRASTEQPRLPEHRDDDLSMVSARDIYRKAENPGIERIPHAQATGNSMPRMPPQHPQQPFGGHDMPPREPAFRESPITAEPDGRIRVPRSMPVARDEPATSLRDKEKVIRYVREHGDGVSFIQMSNDLEIAPNKLTIITKELVINDDIEKVKGLYFYKSHDTAPDEGKSSVVVWRLDGED